MTAIDDKYASLGREGGFLGRPTTAETRCPDGTGYFRHFEGGSIYWHPMTGAHEVHGGIWEKWRQLGWERSILGYPITDESDAARGGKYNHFMGGSIYWTGTTGAQSVYGPIRDKWQELGWEYSAIGFPTSDATQTLSGELRQRFQGGLIGWTPQSGTYLLSELEKLEKVVRVFLVRFADVPNPSGYTRDYFNRLFFSANELRNNPDGGPISGSVYDYFYGISDGYFRITGEVVDWTNNPLRVTQVKHWYGGVNADLFRGGLKMLGAAVAQTLRTRGIRTLDDLKVNGRVPDGLVFFHTDVWGGGATRNMWDVRAELTEAGRMDLWDAAWENWAYMSLISIPCCQQVPAPSARPDGTFQRVPTVSELRWTSTAVLVHELGHLLLGYPDLYNQFYQWGTWFEVMGSDWPWNDFPPVLSSFMQERGGWFSMTDMPRRTHRGLILEPFETHNIAFRFQNGPMNSPETVVLETRTRWDLNVAPPTNLGNAVFAYRVDPQMRQAILMPNMHGSRRATFLIRRPEAWGEAWGIPGATNLTGLGPQLGNSLNHLGERWWEFRNIQVLADGAVQLDAEFQPFDLIRGYAQANWTNGAARQLKPDFFSGAQGHVMLINRSLPIEQGLRYNHVLSLHPEWIANGKIRGRYSLNIPADGAKLYLTVALSEQAVGSDGFTFRVIAPGSPDRVMGDVGLTLNRNVRTIVIDLSDFRGSTRAIILEVDAGPTANRDWAYLLEAYLVPTSRLIYDFIEQSASAAWRSNDGSVAFGVSGRPQGEASKRELARLQNGFLYGGDVLFTHPAWRNDGFIEGAFSLMLPRERSVFRAEVGFDENRSVTDNGARVNARFIPDGGTEQVILPNTLLERRPVTGEVGLQHNPVTSVAAPIPSNLAGVSGRFILRVEADGNAGQDWVWWPMARLAAD